MLDILESQKELAFTLGITHPVSFDVGYIRPFDSKYLTQTEGCNPACVAWIDNWQKGKLPFWWLLPAVISE